MFQGAKFVIKLGAELAMQLRMQNGCALSQLMSWSTTWVSLYSNFEVFIEA